MTDPTERVPLGDVSGRIDPALTITHEMLARLRDAPTDAGDAAYLAEVISAVSQAVAEVEALVRGVEFELGS